MSAVPGLLRAPGDLQGRDRLRPRRRASGLRAGSGVLLECHRQPADQDDHRAHAASARSAADPARRHVQPTPHRGGCGHSGASDPFKTSPRKPTSASVRRARPRRRCDQLDDVLGGQPRARQIRCDSVRDGSRATCRRCSCTSGTRFPHRIDRAAPDGRVRAAHRRCAADVPLHAAASRALRRVVGAAARDCVSVAATMFAVRVGLRNTAVTAHVLSRWWR